VINAMIPCNISHVTSRPNVLHQVCMAAINLALFISRPTTRQQIGRFLQWYYSYVFLQHFHDIEISYYKIIFKFNFLILISNFYLYYIFCILHRLRQFSYYLTVRLNGSVVTNSDFLDIFYVYK
jgi:hypothetical protein